jgi:hypothetical protein
MAVKFDWDQIEISGSTYSVPITGFPAEAGIADGEWHDLFRAWLPIFIPRSDSHSPSVSASA